MEKNERSKQQFPPYRPSSNINIIPIHRLSTITQIDELISKAKCTKRFTLDTESERSEHVNQGALVQIQFIHSIYNSTVLIIEVNYLPDPTSTLFQKIKELCMIIFNNNNEIISRGEFIDEIKHFHYLDFIHPGNIHHINLQFLFSNPNADTKTHPAKERRDNESRDVLMHSTPGGNVYYNILDDDDYYYDDDDMVNDINPVQVNQNQPISLQNAIATTFKKFLDKSLTYNYWKCGLDPYLKTWKTKLFNKKFHDEQLEKSQRQLMIQYAIHDCTAVTELFFHMYPEKINDHQTPPETPRTTTIEFNNDLSDISEDELIEMLKPKLNSKTSSSDKLNNQQQQSVEQTDPIHEQQPQEQVQQTTRLSKAEKQRKKNEKYKWKKRNRPTSSTDLDDRYTASTIIEKLELNYSIIRYIHVIILTLIKHMMK